MEESKVVVNLKRRCRITLEDTGDLKVEEYFKKGQNDRGNLVKQDGWVELWKNTVAKYNAGTLK